MRQSLGRVPVDVTTGDVTGVMLAIAPPLELQGIVRAEEPEKLNPRGGRIVLSSTSDELRGRLAAAVGPDHSFKMPRVAPDKYFISGSGFSEDAYIKSARMGSQDLLSTGLDLIGVRSASPIEVTLSTMSAFVDGTALDDGQAAANRVVTLVPDPPRIERSAWLKSTRSNAEGKFTITGIAPGRYRLYAWDEPQADLLSDPGFLKSFENKAVALTVQEGERKEAVVPVSKVEDMN